MFWVVVLMLLIAIFTVPNLYQEKSYKELAVFFLLWLISGTYALFVVSGISIISPFETITNIVKQIRG